MVGPLVLLLVLLGLIAGLIVFVRALLVRLHGRVANAADRERARRGSSGVSRAAQGEMLPEGAARPVTGRMLKGRYLRGEISKSEYDARLRQLQLDEYLEDER